MKKPTGSRRVVGNVVRLKQKEARPLVWVGSSKQDLSAFPDAVKMSFGLRLFELQLGGTPLDVKPMTQFGGGVYELRDSYRGDAYRAIYVLNIGPAIYVLHAFVKKSKSGIGLPKSDIDVIERRLRHARTMEGDNFR